MTVEDFTAKWQVFGGNERAHTPLFVSGLCHLLGVALPAPALTDTQRNDYAGSQYRQRRSKVERVLVNMRRIVRVRMETMAVTNAMAAPDRRGWEGEVA